MAARREFSVRDCVKSYVIDIQRRFERGNHDADGLDYTVFRLDWVINILVRYSGSEGIQGVTKQSNAVTSNGVTRKRVTG